jgi:Ser/Thr protein kinase RdoA (MazF antagonist)
MLQFTKPENLNGAELLNELAANGIACDNPPLIDGEGKFWLDIKPADESNAAAVVAAHNGNTVAPEPTIEDKLASVGLTLPDLKAALGL